MFQVKALLPMQPDKPLAWAVMDNRPVLRVVGFLADTMEAMDDDQTALEMREWLLRLNPNDNQGMRELVVNAYLQLDRNQDAIALSEHYPEDFDVSICYGHALALFRIGDRKKADMRLDRAVRQSPRVADAIARTSMEPPKALQPGLVTCGGEDEAWFYREQARDLWLATPGAMGWLKKYAKSVR